MFGFFSEGPLWQNRLLKICILYYWEIVFSQSFFGKGVRNANIGDKILGVSLSGCTTECLDRPSCAAVDYHRNRLLCYLYSAEEYQFAILGDTPGCFHKNLTADTVANSQNSVLVKCDARNVCEMTGCPFPQTTNAQIRGNLRRTGSRVQVGCGVDVTTWTSSVCETNGTWSHPLHCQNTFNCGPPPSMQNAVAENISAVEARYTCLPGFQQTGIDNIISCTGPDGWSQVSINCSIICGEPPIIPNTNVSYAENTEGQTRVYTCIDGYSTENGTGSAEITCGSDGIWTPIEFVCSPGCGSLPLIENGKFSEGNRSVGSDRHFTCDDGYTLHDGQRDGVVMCSEQTEWEPNAAIICEPLLSLGKFCTADSDCVEPNTTCHRNWCFCKPLHTFSFQNDVCYESCNKVLNTFTQINGSYIGWYWSDEINLSLSQTCESVCLSDSACLFYEHLHADALDCRVGYFSLQQFLDAQPDSISQYSLSKLFIRDCE